MKFPENGSGEKQSSEANAEFLRGFRTHCEKMAQGVVDRFGAHPEAKEVVRKLIEARMWSGNLFGYCEVKDLNRERENTEQAERGPDSARTSEETKNE